MKEQARNKSNAKSVKLCDDLDFILHEEYRMLRTNIKYSITDEKAYHAIGITSSVQGEAKSTTAINLAYTLAENGEKVCLVEGDMRLPTFRQKLGLKPDPGLSEFLTGQASINDIIKRKSCKKCSFSYIQAGVIPPNPAELLSSKRMDKMLEALGTVFTYIIVDLPPVDMVPDAVIVGGKLDGVLMVVAQTLCTKRLLRDAMRQLTMARIKVLGFVRTVTTENGFAYTKYSKKRYAYYGGYEHTGNRKGDPDDTV